jgi:hypothetical protein
VHRVSRSIGNVIVMSFTVLTSMVPQETAAQRGASDYAWTRVVDAAPYPGSYNFPVFVVGAEMWAFQAEGRWSSRDGTTWTRSTLPASGLNSGYQKYIQLGDAVYALGTMTGNYLDPHLTSRIARTRDFKRWEVVAEQSNLPRRMFYGALVFDGKIWLMGGYDGRRYYDDVWSSPDGVHWTRAVEHAGWSPRNVDVSAVFKDRMWIIGGGVIDGSRNPTPNSTRETWSSADGVHWARSPDRPGRLWGGTPVVYDQKLWMIGANRNETFAPALLVSDDGTTWNESVAPWSPRGAPAVWVFGDKLFMTGGKYSVTENGTQRFIYRNDVWTMSRGR